MGEYATFNGQRIKIGTCENMYYLRADQLHLVRSAALFDLTDLRLRFPFPDEDHREPGDFDDCDRSLTVRGYEIPDGVNHDTVQFKATAGILISLPCLYSAAAKANGINYHFNSFHGPARIVQQRIWAGVWATVMACGPCGAKFRLPNLDTARPLLDAIAGEAAKAERHGSADQAAMWRTVADRVERGYHTPAPAPDTGHH